MPSAEPWWRRWPNTARRARALATWRPMPMSAGWRNANRDTPPRLARLLPTAGQGAPALPGEGQDGQRRHERADHDQHAADDRDADEPGHDGENQSSHAGRGC